jgi:hypothetical protein
MRCLREVLMLAITLIAPLPAMACSLETLDSSGKEQLAALLGGLKAEVKKCSTALEGSKKVVLPYIEIWIDKDQKTLRREGAGGLNLTLVVVNDGTIGLERNFSDGTAYTIGMAPAGTVRSYYLKSFIDGKYRVVSNVLYVKS